MTASIQKDIELWHLVRQDDRVAYEALYRRHMRVLYTAIYKWTENQADAEDILQEVFLDIWEKRQRIHIQQEVFSYLYAVTRYKVLDHVKNKKISTQQLQAWELIPADSIANTAFGQEPLEPASIMIDNEIAQLPPQMKQVYQLRFREEKSIQEIADTLLVSPNTVKNHLQKIRKRLQAATLRLTSFLCSCLVLMIGNY